MLNVGRLLTSTVSHLEAFTIDASEPSENFDLLEFQQRARETCCPKKLFAIWEDVCRRYERKEIGPYQLEEMKEVIWPTLEALASLRRCVNGLTVVPKKKMRKRA